MSPFLQGFRPFRNRVDGTGDGMMPNFIAEAIFSGNRPGR